MGSVHTAYGPGQIVGSQTIHGRTQYQVEGNGFNVWIDAARVGGVPEHDFNDPSFSDAPPDRHGVPIDNRDYPSDEELNAMGILPELPSPYLEKTLRDMPQEDFGPDRDDRHAAYEPDKMHNYEPDLPKVKHFLLDPQEPSEEALKYKDIWLDRMGSYRHAAPGDHIMDDNSVRLPYNPDPQHDATMPDYDSTIQPGTDIDADERLHPADSLDFDDRASSEAGPWPGPNPDLFARSAGFGSWLKDEFGDDDDQSQGPLDMSQYDPYQFDHKNPSMHDLVDIDDPHDSRYGPLSDEDVDTVRGIMQHQQGERPGSDQMALFSARQAGYDELGPGMDDHDDDEDSAEHALEEANDEVDYKKKHAGGFMDFVHDILPGGMEEHYRQEERDRLEGKPPPPGLLDSIMGPDPYADEVAEPAEQWLEEHPGPLPTGKEKDFDDSRAEGLDKAAGHGDRWQTHSDQPDGFHDDDTRGYQRKYKGTGDRFNDDVPIGSEIYRPAGLSDRFAYIPILADHFNDPVQQFRDDPITFLTRRAAADISAGLNPEVGEYMNLVMADRQLREAAWVDVREKAMRLRTSGAVRVKDIDSDRIYASVDGDHGTYDVMIVKGSDYSPSFGNNGSQGISNWSCSCDWGKWAFKRQQTFIGRLCSHGYASYMEMQSLHHNKKTRNYPYTKAAELTFNPKDMQRGMGPNDDRGFGDLLEHSGPHNDLEQEFKSRTQQAEDYANRTDDGRDDYGIDDDPEIKHFGAADDVPNRQWLADMLRLYPKSLTPDTNPISHENIHAIDRVDVEKDERKTTGPGQITAASLDDLRDLVDKPQHEDFGNMDQRRERIRDAVDDLREQGYDASPLVASLNLAYRVLADDDRNRGLIGPGAAGTHTTPGTVPGGAADVSGQASGDQSFGENGTNAGGGSVFGPSLGTPPATGAPPPAAGAPAGSPGGLTNPGLGTPSGNAGIDNTTYGNGGATGGGNSAAPPAQDPSASGGGSNSPGVSNGQGTGAPPGPAADPAAADAGAPQQQPVGDPSAGTTDQGAGGGGGDAGAGVGDFMSVAEPFMDAGASMLGDVGSSFADSFGGGLGDMASGLAGDVGSALSGFLGSIHTADGYYDDDDDRFMDEQEINPVLHDGFAGSGPAPKYWMSDSQDYVDSRERKNFEKVDSGDGEVTKFATNRFLFAGELPNDDEVYHGETPVDVGMEPGSQSPPAQGEGRTVSAAEADKNVFPDTAAETKVKRQLHDPSYIGEPSDWSGPVDYKVPEDKPEQKPEDWSGDVEYKIPTDREASVDDDSDVVRQFQRNAGWIMQDRATGPGDGDIADRAQAFLKAAGRHYTFAEQAALMNERHPLGARNLDELDLEGTHYLGN